jgi:hypothetical protein
VGVAGAVTEVGIGGRTLRAVAGVLAGGLTVLALVLLAGFAMARVERSPGPGLGMLVGHGLAAAASVVLAIVADRRPDSRGSLAAGAVIVLAAVVLGFYWWA